MANDRFEYEVALSFASEDSDVAQEFASALRAKNINVLSDEYQADKLGRSDFVTQIAELCRTKAHYCVMLISQHYPLKRWTEEERTSVQEHALRDADEYIVPVQLDDTDVPGMDETKGYKNLREHSIENIAKFLEQRLTETNDRSGPPSQSHDLRSGNVPSDQDQS